MNRRIVIDPDYSFLERYIRDIPDNFDSLGEIIHDDRNILRRDSARGVELVIKSFRRIYLPNKIRYTYFYPSKARRAFDYAKILLKEGFNTPKPISYIERTENGLLTQSYFVCEYTDFEPLKMIRELPPAVQDELLKALSFFAYRLHQSHIYHGDFSIGNVLYKKIGDHFEFSLVDNNRIKFGSVSFERGIRTMGRLGLPAEQLVVIAKIYGRLWNIDEIVVLERLFHHQRSIRNSNSLKKSGKQLLQRLDPVVRGWVGGW
jgi:hypothetical protein